MPITTQDQWDSPRALSKPERYWSGGTKPHGETPCVDVFVDGSTLSIGVHNGATGSVTEITVEEAEKIAQMLRSAILHATEWEASTKS